MENSFWFEEPAANLGRKIKKPAASKLAFDPPGEAVRPSAKKQTPMMRQYLTLKEKHADKLLFFRLGDFYEFFYEDAEQAAEWLGLTLTKRNGVAMCGLPYHQLGKYVNRLLAMGKKAAIAEQEAAGVGEQLLSSNRLLVERKITRIFTPGTVVEEANLNAKENNFIVSLFWSSGKNNPTSQGASLVLGALDLSTGEVELMELEKSALAAAFVEKSDEKRQQLLKEKLVLAVEKYFPKELLLPESCAAETQSPPTFAVVLKKILEDNFPRALLNFLPAECFHEDYAAQNLKAAYPTFSLETGQVSQNPLYLPVLSALVEYAKSNYGAAAQRLKHLKPPKIISLQNYLVLDRQAIAHLELFKNSYSGERENTLLESLNHTKTAMGSRLLIRFLVRPPCHLEQLEKRLATVEAFFKAPQVLTQLRSGLQKIQDLERTATRLALETLLPKEAVALSHSLKKAHWLSETLAEQLSSVLEFHPQEKLAPLKETLAACLPFQQKITDTLLPDPSNNLAAGGYIKAECEERLQKDLSLKKKHQALLLALEAEERKNTQVNFLKIKYNENLGYFFETSRNTAHLLPERFVKKQTLMQVERFVTKELSQLEGELKLVEERARNLELSLYKKLRRELQSAIPLLQKTADCLAYLDVLSNFAALSLQRRYQRPKITAASLLEVKNARHPIMELSLTDPFIPNSLRIGEPGNNIHLLTGPNMSGKSTFLRQNALLVLMAHLGCFVAADQATVPLTDQIFTRIGSGDRLSKGQSTFLVEMHEVANLLVNTTERSFIIMDEVGRGTSTYDGLSIAWGILEYLDQTPSKRAKTLFATHYHELTALGAATHSAASPNAVKKLTGQYQFSGIKNFNVRVKEEKGELLFMKKVAPGAASKSYGVEVSRLAGLPKAVITRAEALLKTMEKKALLLPRPKATANPQPASEGQPPPPLALLAPLEQEVLKQLRDKILALKIETLAPLQALTLLADLQKTLAEAVVAGSSKSEGPAGSGD